MSADTENILRVCREVLAPLIEHDRGELYLVSLEGNRLSLHLAGRCAGCPGVRLTTAGFIEPALRAIAPRMQVAVTAGFRLPNGAIRLPAPVDRQPTDPDVSASSFPFPGPTPAHQD